MSTSNISLPGLEIRFEGGEGAGKSTVAHKTVQQVEKLGIPVLLTREPGGTPFADGIRGLILSEDGGNVSPRTTYLLFSASRSDTYERVVEPAIQKGITVFGDRSWVSSMAYQVYAEGLDQDFAQFVADFIIGGRLADLTMVFDLPIEVGLARRHRGGEVNRIDQAGTAFHKRVRQGFLAMAREHGFPIIDAARTPEQVEAAVWNLISPLIAERYPDIILARQEVK